MTPDLTISRVKTAADWEEVVAIRTRVFIEEQACPPEDEWDEHDTPEARFSTCRHFVGRLAEEAVACARWHPHKFDGQPVAKLERFATLPEARGRGYGREMIAHVVDDAQKAGFHEQFLHAQAHLVGLYADLGFLRVGDVFYEAGIPHVKMVSTQEP